MSAAAAPDHEEEPGAAAGAWGKAPMSTVRCINDYLDDRRRTGGVTRYTAGHMRGPLSAFAEVVPEDASRITRGSVLTWLCTSTTWGRAPGASTSPGSEGSPPGSSAAA